MTERTCRTADAAHLVRAGSRAWDDLRAARQPVLVPRARLEDPYVAGKVLERWLMRRAANAS